MPFLVDLFSSSHVSNLAKSDEFSLNYSKLFLGQLFAWTQCMLSNFIFCGMSDGQI